MRRTTGSRTAQDFEALLRLRVNVFWRAGRSRPNEHVEFEERAGGLSGRPPEDDTIADHHVLYHRACTCHVFRSNGTIRRHTAPRAAALV
jgi:hypothetical protein